MIGVLGGLINHMAVALGVGFAGGIITTIWSLFVQPWSNRHRILDSGALTSLFLTSSFFGSIVVAPSIVAAYITTST